MKYCRPKKTISSNLPPRLSKYCEAGRTRQGQGRQQRQRACGRVGNTATQSHAKAADRDKRGRSAGRSAQQLQHVTAQQDPRSALAVVPTQPRHTTHPADGGAQARACRLSHRPSAKHAMSARGPTGCACAHRVDVVRVRRVLLVVRHLHTSHRHEGRACVGGEATR